MSHVTRTSRTRTSKITALVGAILLFSLLVAPTATADSREQQWYLDAMQTDAIWKVSKGKGMTVAVLDAGVDSSLPELRGQVLKGKNLHKPKESPHMDNHGHGTSMAALIAGTGASEGIQGLAPEAKILPITISDWEFRVGMEKNLPEAINYAVDNGANIINLSFGVNLRENIPPGTQEAINRAYKKGTLIFAGSGNNGAESNARSYPAALPGVIAVGATNKQAKPAKFSSHGQHLALSAPGTEMTMRCDKNTTTCLSDGGTSAAAALTSASAALIWAKHPTWTNNQVLRTMVETAGRKGAKKDDPPSTDVGFGEVRPRMVLVEGEGNPGDPDEHPTFSKYYASLDAKSPSPSNTSKNDPPDDEKQSGADENSTDTANEDNNDNNTTLILGGAATAALLAIGLTTTALLRRRRNSRTH